MDEQQIHELVEQTKALLLKFPSGYTDANGKALIAASDLIKQLREALADSEKRTRAMDLLLTGRENKIEALRAELERLKQEALIKDSWQGVRP